MELGIQGRIGSPRPPVQNNSNNHNAIVLTVRHRIPSDSRETERKTEETKKFLSKDDLERIIRRILKDASLLNRDLKYSVNSETDQIVVKVIDKSTDKVIKEIPPEEIQRLQARLKQEIGLLIDEQI